MCVVWRVEQKKVSNNLLSPEVEIRLSCEISSSHCGEYEDQIRPDDGGSTYLWNVGRKLFYTAVHPRRQIWILD
jgi:hypothetical protein